eukprot:CAMPEP_0181206480 /NCGR_PEP_ID=MMETSP1096-20121128/21057_1 /TAXON_ID=156174 ORGANISM="Chrysochromulina ericina, Strain CCMP281" /NCGR_SAMPLE_ID=MMETSP1096 /ASSEMBLY_ACC=CAM_ASM_000453 /LENGTH=215 /DNA_ID=CAMNT_0023297381 /DNA_START=733 /DNA_END=1376 /DNA_ORIENTATION=+
MPQVGEASTPPQLSPEGLELSPALVAPRGQSHRRRETVPLGRRRGVEAIGLLTHLAVSLVETHDVLVKVVCRRRVLRGRDVSGFGEPPVDQREQRREGRWDGADCPPVIDDSLDIFKAPFLSGLVLYVGIDRVHDGDEQVNQHDIREEDEAPEHDHARPREEPLHGIEVEFRKDSPQWHLVHGVREAPEAVVLLRRAAVGMHSVQSSDDALPAVP